MLDGVPAIAIVQGGAVAVLGIFVLAILRGWLVPRRTLLDVRADRDDRVRKAEEREEQWRVAYFKMGEAANELVRQNSELLEVAHTGAAVMEALPPSRGRTRS